MKAVTILLSCVILAAFAAAVNMPVQPASDSGPAVVTYDPVRYPGIECLEGRIIAETVPGLSESQRNSLWREYELDLTFEWINPETGFTYHELEIRRQPLPRRLLALFGIVDGSILSLPDRVEHLNADSRVNWAAPDALALVWCQSDGWGASLLDGRYRPFDGTAADWMAETETQDPFPDFEYYRICSPDGTAAIWDSELASVDGFSERYPTLYGTNQYQAAVDYRNAGSPKLSPVTVCVADTGVYFNHPDLAGRMHPNAIDANYRNYSVAKAQNRPAPDLKVEDRYTGISVGLPREAIKGRPSSHGTSVAGIVQRCTEGFNTRTGAVRILPASIKSEKAFVVTGYRVKSPISSFIKLVSCLYEDFPVGDYSYSDSDPTHNSGDVRVVSVSASIPKSMFSDAEWRVVANLIGKAEGSIAEDLTYNDRLYVFAAGNEAQGEANKPGDAEFVLPVSATSAYDGGEPWAVPLAGEGSNLFEGCVSAPGYGIITSTIYECPNLAYLPLDEFRVPRKNWAIPQRDFTWERQTNTFSATSSATPQVSSLAALLYAQEPQRDFHTVMQLIRNSTGQRRVKAEWGESQGIVDYGQALDW